MTDQSFNQQNQANNQYNIAADKVVIQHAGEHPLKSNRNNRREKSNQKAPNFAELKEYLDDDKCYLPKGHYELPNGKHSSEYIHARIGMMNSRTRTAFAKAMIHRLSDMQLEYDMFAAGTVGGILLAKEAAKLRKVPLLIGRKIADTFVWVNTKDYLKPNSLSRIVVVDDILSTSGTLKSEIKSLDAEIKSQAYKAKIVQAVVAVTRNLGITEVSVGNELYKILPLLPSPLVDVEPGENTCLECSNKIPIIHLYDAENDIIQTIESMPSDKAKMIIDAYTEASELQEDERALKLIKRLGPLLVAARQCFGQYEPLKNFSSSSVDED